MVILLYVLRESKYANMPVYLNPYSLVFFA